MKLKNIAQIENKLGYSFRDPALLTQAFTRTSFCNEKNYGGKENYSSNEVLEFFGDSVLSTAIVTLLMRKNTTRYAHGIRTSLTEGDFSNIRSKLSDKRNLSKRIAELGFQKFMLLGEGDEKLSINEEASVMEDLFESIIGAVYIDCGMDIETVISVVERMLDINEYANGEAPIQSYKNALQEWCADKKHRLPTPVYKTISENADTLCILRKYTAEHKSVLVHIDRFVIFKTYFSGHMNSCTKIICNLFGIFAYLDLRNNLALIVFNSAELIYTAKNGSAGCGNHSLANAKTIDTGALANHILDNVFIQ